MSLTKPQHLIWRWRSPKKKSKLQYRAQLQTANLGEVLALGRMVMCAGNEIFRSTAGWWACKVSVTEGLYKQEKEPTYNKLQSLAWMPRRECVICRYWGRPCSGEERAGLPIQFSEVTCRSDFSLSLFNGSWKAPYSSQESTEYFCDLLQAALHFLERIRGPW